MTIRALLSGGNPRSLGDTDVVVQSVLLHQDKLNELFDCLFIDDEIVRMRAGDALEKVCRSHPDWLTPYIDQLLTDVAAIEQSSVQWHVAQMIGQLELNQDQYSRAVCILKRNLEHATDWIVLNYSLAVFAQFARKDSTLRIYFVEQLHKHQKSHHKSVAKRAAKLLATF